MPNHLLCDQFYVRILVLVQGFLTGGTCTPWGYEQPNQGVRDEESEYQLF